MLDDIQLAVACMVETATRDEIKTWINAEKEKEGETDPAVYGIFSKDVGVSRARYGDYFRDRRPGFRMDSEEGIAACKFLLDRELCRLLNEEIGPSDFCGFISALEVRYMDTGRIFDDDPRYPEFIGGLWNACDWCDDWWTLASAPHLREEAEQVRAHLKAPQGDGADPRR